MDPISNLLPAKQIVWRPRADQYALTVVCKATYSLEPNLARLADDQEPLFEMDRFFGDDPRLSLALASELCPLKRHCDVIFTGHAYTPDGKPQPVLTTRLAVGHWEKSVEVVEDRVYARDGSPCSTSGFTRMPLVYERAAGGPGSANPPGRHAGLRDTIGNLRLPNIVAPGSAYTAFAEPIGYGPIPANWPQRAGLTGAEWVQSWPSAVMPEGFDYAAFNAAPPDQQLQEIPADAVIVLENLMESIPLLRTRLPGSPPTISLVSRAGARNLAARIDTLHIDGDREIVMVVWRAQVGLGESADLADTRVVIEMDRGPDQTALLTRARAGTQKVPIKLPAGDVRQTLPFSRAGVTMASAAAAAASSRRAADCSAESLRATVAQRPIDPPPSSPRPAPIETRADHSAPPPLQTIEAMAAVQQAPAPVPFPARRQSAPGLLPAPVTPQPPPAPDHAVASAHSSHPRSPSSAPVASQPLPKHPARLSHNPAAAQGGLVEASNAAADPRPGAQPDKPWIPTADGLRVLWHEPEAGRALRRRADWRAILAKREKRPPGSRELPAAPEVEEAREVFEVLRVAHPADAAAVLQARHQGQHEDGCFEPELVVTAGELRFQLDPLEALKATVAMAAPFGPRDAGIASAQEAAKAYLGVPDQVGIAELEVTLRNDIRRAFSDWAGRPFTLAHFDETSERALLERRAYESKEIFGDTYYRALLSIGDSSEPIPTYVDKRIQKKLPLFRSIKVRLVAEVHHSEDELESSPTCLRAMAVARVLPAQSGAS